jgi:hypothetical protein
MRHGRSRRRGNRGDAHESTSLEGGFGAALLMVSTNAYLRALVETYPHPCDLITRVHTALRRELEPNRSLDWTSETIP